MTQKSCKTCMAFCPLQAGSKHGYCRARSPVPVLLGMQQMPQVSELIGGMNGAPMAQPVVQGFFPPVEHEGMLLCDAGLVNNLPTQLARDAGDGLIVAVDLSAGLPPCRHDAVGMEVLLRVQEISTRLANQRCARQADVVITPDLDGRHWLDTSGLTSVIEAGERAAHQAVPRIRALLDERGGKERRAS